jgi:hypothetical protein
LDRQRERDQEAWMRRPAIAALVLVGSLATFGAVTVVALEGRGVAVLRTIAPTGEERRTRVWVAEYEGALWVESATATRPFYLDLLDRPDLVVEIHDSPFDAQPAMVHGHAELVAEPGGHTRVRTLLAARYGWADAWIGLLQDTSASRAVRIVTGDAAPD